LNIPHSPLFLIFILIGMIHTALQAESYRLNSLEITLPEIQAWQSAEASAVAPSADRHSIHSYFNACPESPDGRYVLYFSSLDPAGEFGDICIVERATGQERVLVSGVTSEDAHRVACQQWSADGRKVAYHDFRDGRWQVASVDIESGEQRVLAMDRQIGFGTPTADWVPIYGPHWKQGQHRDLELVNVDTGEIRTVLSIEEVLESYAEEVKQLVGDGDISIFFPVVSPDGSQVYFKIALGRGLDDFRAGNASKREGKFVYDLANHQFVGLYGKWGHPSWSPDSTGIFEKGNYLLDLTTGKTRHFVRRAPTNHPTMSPTEPIFVTDADISKREEGRPGEWGIIIGSLQTEEFATIYRFDHSDGARSWRKPHPHPAFSADGRRIYFNVSGEGWTRLLVLEIPSEV
jgi:Tol biopolymer transport system component